MQMNKVKKIVKKFIPKRYRKFAIEWKNWIFDDYATRSYSQEGEDMVLRGIFEKKKTPGFYVDVGAHHPMRFSNTYYFHKKGWRGINIDAMPESMKIFERVRPKDINLEIAISDKKQILTYYMFNDSALNGFSKELSTKYKKMERYRIIREIKIETLTLAAVLGTYLPEDVEIDFLSMDVEGLDFQVLKSNNWSKYKPKVILVESLDFSFYNLDNSETYRFLVDKDYHLDAKIGRTLFFVSDGTVETM